MVKLLREGSTYNQKDVIELLAEFSAFKDRVHKRFREVAKELEGKGNEHDLWVNLFLIATDYADDWMSRQQRQEIALQKIS
ncbi:hypothetical protein [Desulfothermobacter acidiphilus]|uniref:hypothetical protein n=1 Tax=Desulfothermobacter acidiphilus TaxID=1938353 RepID=UPI003F893740